MESNPQYSQREEQKLSVADLWRYMLSHWMWFAISVGVCVALAWYRSASSPRIYFCSATVIIKDPENKSYSAGLDRFDSYINRVNVANELLQFKSATLMSEVVERLDANISYKIKDKLRMQELYKSSPVQVTIEGLHPEKRLSFGVRPTDSTTVEVYGLDGRGKSAASRRVGLGDTLHLGGSAYASIAATRRYGPAWYGREIEVEHLPMSDAVAYFQGSLAIRQAEEESSILTIAIRDFSPRRAREIVSCLIDVYNEEAINDKNRVAVNTGRFIDERLRIIEGELGAVESALQQFKRQNGIVDIASTTSRFMKESERYDAQEIEQSAQLEWARYVKEYLSDPTAQNEPFPAHTGLAGMNIESQIASYNALQLKRRRLAGESGSSNPLLQEIDDRLASSRESIIRSIDNLIANLAQRRSNAAGQKRKSMEKVAAIPQAQREMLSIERQQKIKETLYLFLLNKREENALTKAMADNNARLIDTPGGSRTSIAPRPKRSMAIGAVVGLIVPATLLLFGLFIDTKVRSRKEIEGKLSLPFLGEIPFAPQAAKRKRESGRDDGSGDADDPLSESFRILRTNLLFFNKPGNPVKSVTLSSFNEGAGKTFVVRHLALSLAKAKKRVLVIDLDVRKGSLSHSLRARKVGITNYLTDDELGLDDIVQQLGPFDFISSGATAPNPAELLMERRLDEMMEELKLRYDYILVDNVPVDMVADATIANRIADLTIFVARAGRFDRRQLPDIERLHNEHKLKNMALLLNGADVTGRYGYYYSNGYCGYRRHPYGRQHKKTFLGRHLTAILVGAALTAAVAVWALRPSGAAAPIEEEEFGECAAKSAAVAGGEQCGPTE